MFETDIETKIIESIEEGLNDEKIEKCYDHVDMLIMNITT